MGIIRCYKKTGARCFCWCAVGDLGSLSQTRVIFRVSFCFAFNKQPSRCPRAICFSGRTLFLVWPLGDMKSGLKCGHLRTCTRLRKSTSLFPEQVNEYKMENAPRVAAHNDTVHCTYGFSQKWNCVLVKYIRKCVVLSLSDLVSVLCPLTGSRLNRRPS